MTNPEFKYGPCGRQPKGLILALTVAILGVSLPSGAVPPVRKHYAAVFVVKNFAELPLTTIFDCLRFSRTKICLRDGECGSFRITEPGRRQNSWEAEIDFIDDSGPTDEVVHAVVRGITENTAAGSSISATAVLERAGIVTNTAIAGTQTRLGVCRAFADVDSENSVRSKPGR